MTREEEIDKAMMLKAWVNASMSKCKKRAVGVVAVKDERVILEGRNGTLPDTDNNCEHRFIPCSKCGIELSVKDFVLRNKSLHILTNVCKCGTRNNYLKNEINDFIITETNNDVIHAEPNIILYAAKEGISLKGTIFYITKVPCLSCGVLIAGAGIVEVVYSETSKSADLRGEDYLRKNGIIIRQYQIDGDVLVKTSNK